LVADETGQRTDRGRKVGRGGVPGHVYAAVAAHVHVPDLLASAAAEVGAVRQNRVDHQLPRRVVAAHCEADAAVVEQDVVAGHRLAPLGPFLIGDRRLEGDGHAALVEGQDQVAVGVDRNALGTLEVQPDR
jgi:hypothetical protein